MPESLEEQLSLDISPALAAIQSVDDALAQVVANFSEGLTSALDALSTAGLNIDTSGITSSVSDAITAATDPTQTVAVDADTSAAVAEVATVADTTATVPVEADTSQAQAQIDALTATPVEIPIEADTTQAQDAIDNLDTSATDAAGSRAGGGGVGGLTAALTGLSDIAPVASGETQDLVARVAGLGPGAAAAAGGLVAVGGFIGEVTKLAADSQAQLKRFTQTFGDLAQSVQQISVGGLVISLADLGKESGTSITNLEAVASRIGALGQSSGANAPQVAKTTDALLALGATFAVNNPRLGDAATVTDELTNAFARGGRALAPFGLAISATQINLRAMQDTGKQTAADLTVFEKATAGAEIATAQFGDTLGTTFQKGADNAQIQLRSLKVQLEETLSALGGPLLAPLVSSLQSVLPVAVEVGTALGSLAQIALTLIGDFGPELSALASGLGLVDDGLKPIASIIGSIPGPVVAVASAVGLLGGLLGTALVPGLAEAVPALGLFGAAVNVALGPIGLLVGAVAGLGLVLDHFGTHSKPVVTDTSELADAFGTAGAAAGSATSSIDAYLQKQLALKTGGTSGVQIVSDLGISLGDLDKHLQESTDFFLAWYTTLRSGNDPIGNNQKALNQFSETVLAARDRLEANAKATLQFAEANKVLSVAEVTAAENATRDKDGYIDNISALRVLTPELNAHVAALQASTNAAARASGSFRQLAADIASGATTITNAADVATQLGISEADAKTFINDQTAAVSAQKDAFFEAIPAAQALRQELELGNITAAQAQVGFANLGLGIGSIAGFTESAASAVASMVSTIEGALPSTESAISDFQKNADTALTKLADDTKKHTGSVKDDLKSLADDQDPQRFVENLLKQTALIQSFGNNLAKIAAEGFPGLAASLAKAGPEVAGGLAEGLASDPAKAKVAASVEILKQEALDKLGGLGPALQAGTEAQAGIAAGTFLSGLHGPIAADQTIPAAAAELAARASARFKPDFVLTGLNPQLLAAAAAMQRDPKITQAAGDLALRSLAAFKGKLTIDQAISQALTVAENVVTIDSATKAAFGIFGVNLSGSIASGFDVVTPVTQKTAEATTAAKALLGALPAAGLTSGTEAGAAVDTGLIAGMASKQALVQAQAVAVAQALTASVLAALGIKSPSTVGIGIGQQFVAGINVGLGDTSSLSSTSRVLSQTLAIAGSTAARNVGTTILGGLLSGFENPSIVQGAISSLNAALAAAASSTATSAAGSVAASFSTLISSVGTTLPSATTAIATFGQTIVSDSAAVTSALSTYHRGFETLHDDAAKLVPINAALATSDANLLAAQIALDAATASGNKTLIAQDKAARDAAKSLDDHNRALLASAQNRVGTDQSAVGDNATALSAAQKTLADASNPAAFIKNLNAQTEANRDFEESLRKLAAEGFKPLAEQLASQGVAVAGKLAEGLASNRSLAAQAAAAVKNADAFTSAYTAFLTKEFGPQVQAITSAAHVPTALTAPAARTALATTPQVIIAAGGSASTATQPSVQHLNLDLSISMPDGTTLGVKKQVPIVASPARKQTVKAAVVAKALA